MFKAGPIRNLKKVQDYLKKKPRGTIKTVIVAITEYIIGNKRHGLRHDDPYKQTTRKKVYGGGHGTFSNGAPLPDGFYSEEQFRYVMAAIADGRIKIGQRKKTPTNASKGYDYKLTNNGYNATITNESEGAYWSRGWGGWKNWRNTAKVINANIKGALRNATAEVNKVLNKK